MEDSNRREDGFIQPSASYTTRPQEIAALVARITTSSIIRQQPVMRGIDNEVYAIETRDGLSCYVHVRRNGELPFADLAWALGQARTIGAPVPEVLWCDHAHVDGAEREAMIQRTIPGRPLQDLLGGLSDDELRACYRQAVPALAALHQIAVDGLQMRRNGVWDFPDWATLAAAWVTEHQAVQVAFVAAGFTEDECERLLTALERLLRRFPCDRPVLLHGDFTPGHLFFDKALAFTGFVDFGQFHGGSPVFDLDILLPDQYAGDPAWRARLPIAWVREAYGAAPFWDDFDAHRLLYRLHNDLGVLNHFVTSGQTEPLAIVVPTLRALLAEAEVIGGM